MKLKAGTVVTVNLNSKEYQFLLVHTGGNGTERLNIEAPLARLLSAMAIGDTCTWKASGEGAEPMRVELVKVEEATCS